MRPKANKSSGGKSMKTLIATLITTAVLAGLGWSADAARYKHKKKYVRSQAYVPRSSANGYGSNLVTQPQYDLRTIPFGTTLWWQQSDRERGGGGEGGGNGSGP
jgi:hypothetical protein